MTDLQRAMPRPFSARVAFRSDTIVYAVARYVLLALDPFDAERLARARATQSLYWEERIPDLALDVAIEEEDDPDPDNDPNSPAPARMRPLCASCGSDDLTRDAVARWHENEEAWLLSSTLDDVQCGACGRDGANIARWLPIDPPTLCLGDRVKVRSRQRIGGDPIAGRLGAIDRFSAYGAYVRFDARPRERSIKQELVPLSDLELALGGDVVPCAGS